MSTPNPILKAAAPTLIAAIGDLQTLISTIVTGDPAMIVARMDGAVDIFIGQLKLLLPGLATAELAAVGSDANTKLGAIATKLAALNAPASPAPAAS
jgi:hypothetical protein